MSGFHMWLWAMLYHIVIRAGKTSKSLHGFVGLSMQMPGRRKEPPLHLDMFQNGK
ncbi:predicted protein [Sclerotinia sclerotiorum 1980 UF-70]|uniref:Uncharacterized protein n=1 Tax=Sclerotinia sclerotiorum (strain ATCC 18683 / 1980 / Ss-1) TaxID=665079 RepID=A7EUU9_SCLS1|nr:predicted protein [Sclerotinia sclerotiorum 1980 UF-70]EDN93241.1 predicted protein [Sclerotinia sclerotiorum 1980 UF-70]